MVKGLGFRVYGLGFRVWGLGFRVWGQPRSQNLNPKPFTFHNHIFAEFHIPDLGFDYSGFVHIAPERFSSKTVIALKPACLNSSATSTGKFSSILNFISWTSIRYCDNPFSGKLSCIGNGSLYCLTT